MITPRSLAAAGLSIWLALPAIAQTPAPPTEVASGSTPAKTSKVADLANRYHLIERYAREEGKSPSSAVGVYRVGLIEVTRDTIDQPQGAPRRSDSTRQTVFVERAAEVTPMGIVTASLRLVERFKLRPEDPGRTMSNRPFEGLSFLERTKGGDLPLILSHTEGRKLTEYEYEVTARQVYVPHLAAILPTQGVRVGDGWRLPKRGVQSLLGEAGVQDDSIVGKLVELRKEDDGPRMVALISLSGKAKLPIGETVVNAEATFTFLADDPIKPPSPTGVKFSGKAAEGLVEGRGAITELRLARVTTGPLPGPGRLKYQTTREVTMHRQLGVDPALLPLPRPDAKLPGRVEALQGKPGDPAAWLTMVAPSNKFALDHPQDFLPPERAALAPAEPDSAVLARRGTDLLQIDFVPKALTPADLQAKLAAKYALMKVEVLKGTEEWLPELEWPKMKVHRIEAALKLPAPPAGAPSAAAPTRIHIDGYLILTGQSASILALSTTARDAVPPFRAEVEEILKTIRLDPPRPAVDR